jgi:hypothetical protein
MAAPDPIGSALDERCAALIKELRARCPGVLPEDPLPPGRPGKPIPVAAEAWRALLQVACRQGVALAANGRLPASDDELPGVVVWEDGASALAVLLTEIRTTVEDGAVTVALPVHCDQLKKGPALVRITFVVGSPQRPAGVLAATAQRPEGPPGIVELWAQPLTALAWQAVLDTAAAVAAHAGADTDGTPLFAAAFAAAKDRVEVLPQARHPFDRVSRPRAVTP